MALVTICESGLAINYREGGNTKWENRGSETFYASPQRDRVKCRFQEPTNHDDERDKSADDPKKLIGVTD